MPEGLRLTTDARASDDTLLLEDQICFAIYRVANETSRLYRPLLEPFGLTFPQYLALLALWGRPACTVGDLSRALHLESNTLTPLLKRLEMIGYVSRRRDRDDERCVRISLTDKGTAFRAEAATLEARLMRDMGVPEHNIALLRTMLRYLSQHLDKATGVAPIPGHSAGTAKGSSEDEHEHEAGHGYEQQLQPVRRIKVQ